jgi:hypothetical protein
MKGWTTCQRCLKPRVEGYACIPLSRAPYRNLEGCDRSLRNTVRTHSLCQARFRITLRAKTDSVTSPFFQGGPEFLFCNRATTVPKQNGTSNLGVVDCPLGPKSTIKRQFRLASTLADLFDQRASRAANEIDESAPESRLCQSNQRITALQNDAGQQLKFHRFQLSAPVQLQFQN